LNIDKDSKYDYVTVLSASIPKSYYLISLNNRSFTLKEGSSYVTITLPLGNYTRKSLANTVSELLTSLSPNGYTYTITYDNMSKTKDDGKYVFTVSNNSGVQPSLIFTNEVYEQLGFDINTTNTFVNDVLTSVDVINLSNETTLFIYSDICMNVENSILQEIYTSGDISYSYVNFNNMTPYEYSKKVFNNQSNTYSFIILDENGREINTNGINVNITLMLYKRNNINEFLKEALKFFAELIYEK